MNNSFLRTLPVAIIAIGISVAYNAMYIVTETEQVVVTQFGKVVGVPVKEPGLKFKMPFLQNANYFAKNLLVWPVLKV